MEMSTQQHSGEFPRAARRQRGFTLVTMTLSTLLAGVMIAGAWRAYGDMRLQWKVANADRMMDQYAQSAMKDLSNLISWGWGGESVSPGRWQFKVDDIPQEFGDMRRNWRRDFQYDMQQFYQVTWRPTEGILYQGRRPGWVQDPRHGGSWYRWFGGRPGRFYLNAIDQRDRITVEGLDIWVDRLGRFRYPSDRVSQVKQAGVIDVRLTLHYRYDAPSWAGMGTRMFGDMYVRERTYETKINQRNWDVQSNPYRDEMINDADRTGGGGS